LQNGTKYHANFLAKKVVILHFGFWPQEKKKTKKEPQEALMRAINSAFWMELNMTLKILAFYISSLQSSWHFAFWILWGTKDPLSQFQ